MLFSEPKIPQSRGLSLREISAQTFQCSSASRKFLNPGSSKPRRKRVLEFQCSSASRKFLNYVRSSVIFRTYSVSVLFSEPKIPQFYLAIFLVQDQARFSALQRAENSSIIQIYEDKQYTRKVSVLFSEPKIPQLRETRVSTRELAGFSALQRAENSSIAKLARSH